MPKQKRRTRVSRVPYSADIEKPKTRLGAVTRSNTADENHVVSDSKKGKKSNLGKTYVASNTARNDDADDKRQSSLSEIDATSTSSEGTDNKSMKDTHDISIETGVCAHSIQLHEEFRLPGPWNRGVYMGIQVLADNRIVVANYEHSVVKLIGTNHEMVDMFGLYQPFGVAAVGSDQVVVTNPRNWQLHFIGVSEKLVMRRTVKTEGAYYGVVCCENQLIVGCSTQQSVYILDITGALLTRLPIHCAHPLYLAVDPDGGKIHVLDDQTLSCKRFDGKTVAEKQFESPNGLAVHPVDGSLFVGESLMKRVHHITPLYDHIETHDVEGVGGTHVMCCNQRGDRLYVTQDMVDNIKVYRIDS